MRGRARPYFIALRLTAEERVRLTRVASINSMGRSAFIRQAINEAAADCIDEPIFEQLDAEDGAGAPAR